MYSVCVFMGYSDLFGVMPLHFHPPQKKYSSGFHSITCSFKASHLTNTQVNGLLQFPPPMKLTTTI